MPLHILLRHIFSCFKVLPVSFYLMLLTALLSAIFTDHQLNYQRFFLLVIFFFLSADYILINCVSEWSHGYHSCVSTNPGRGFVSDSRPFLLLSTFCYSLFISYTPPWVSRPFVTFDLKFFATQLYSTLGSLTFCYFQRLVIRHSVILPLVISHSVFFRSVILRSVCRPSVIRGNSHRHHLLKFIHSYQKIKSRSTD